MSKSISLVVCFFFFHFLIVAIGYTAAAANAKYAAFSNRCLTVYGLPDTSYCSLPPKSKYHIFAYNICQLVCDKIIVHIDEEDDS